MSSQTSLNISHNIDQRPQRTETTQVTAPAIAASGHRSGRKTQLLGTGERLLTVAEVAIRLRMSQQWVRDHIDRRSPKIDVIRWGAAVRFRASDVDRFILEHVNAPRRRKSSG